jgi:hypothetical protein
VWRPTQMQRPYRNYKDEKEIDVPIIILCVLYIYYTVYRGKLEKINERQHIIIYPKRSSGKVYRASHSVIFLIWRQQPDINSVRELLRAQPPQKKEKSTIYPSGFFTFSSF